MALLTLVQQNNNKEIRTNWANEKKVSTDATNFEKLQIEVENNELRELLGNAFLYDIQQNPATAANLELLDGVEFQDCNDNAIKFEGIRYQLSYFNYAEYLLESVVTDTYTGFIQKDRNETQNVSAGTMKNMQLRWRKIALNDFEIMKLFLNENTDTYPLWSCRKTKKIFTPRVNTIRKTVR